MKKRIQLTAMIASALGGTAAFLGLRGFIRWLQQRQHDQRYQQRATERMRGSYGSQQPVDQPDRRQPIPATGERAVSVQELVRESAWTPPVKISNQSELLACYLVAFADLIDTLRTRRHEMTAPASARSLTPADRQQTQEILERLDERSLNLDPGDFPEGSLQGKIYHLTMKVRGTLQKLDASDDDLFRLYGEVRAEACQLLDEIGSGGPDLDYARERYSCD